MQATGLADLENSPSVIFFEALQKQANNLDKDLSKDQKSAIKAAFDKLGYSDYGKKVWNVHMCLCQMSRKDNQFL